MSILYIFSAKTSSRSTLCNVFLTLLIIISLSSCATQQASPEPDVTPIQPVEPTLSPLPLDNLTNRDFKFAQAALEQLGYRVLFVDGIWGPRSAAAIQQFEQDHQLITANGHLSELNYARLSEASTLTLETFDVDTIPEYKTTSIAAKLDSNSSLSSSPQLIITDLSYNILAKPNPYSETVTQIPEGAGLYIINVQQGWYEVETLERERGYISE